MVINKELLRYDDEDSIEYINRICKNRKVYSLTWEKVRDTINEVLGLRYSESYYRKGFKNRDFDRLPIIAVPESEAVTTAYVTSGYISVTTPDEFQTTSEIDSITTTVSTSDYIDPEIEELRELVTELKKTKVKISDERVQNNAYIRRLSREETIKEIAQHYAEVMNKSLIITPPKCEPFLEYDENRQGILLLSDWHYGMVCDNAWNKFDPDICKQRVNKLLKEVITYIERNGIRTITVFNLSDLIAGRIHTQIRIESRFDVITQTMDVAEILAQFLNVLSGHCNIEYYDTLDNHSRLEPNKNDSLDLESLTRIIPWYLKQRLANNAFIKIRENEFGHDIITCKIFDHDIIGVHGDHDSPVNGLDKLTLMTHRHYDLFCTAHRHHMFIEEKNHAIVVGNSSLMGTDSYAEKLRLSCDPSQTFIIASRDNVCECIYRIKLN